MMRRTGYWLCLACVASGLPARTEPGLVGTFTDGTRKTSFVAASPNFYLESGESIHPSLSPEFRGEWSGSLRILENAEYEFSNDVTLNGKTSRKHTLSGGTYAFSLSYSRGRGPASLRLLWRTTAFDWEPVPRGAWSHSMRDEAGRQIERGRKLVLEAACASCHRSTSTEGMERNVPSLAGIGGRTNAKWLYAWLNRHQVAAHTPVQSADLTAHLSTLRSASTPGAAKANEVSVGKGGELFGTLGCAHCHTLSGLGSKYTFDVLTDELLRNHRPSMMLNREDAVSLAAYLIRSTDGDYEKAAPAGDALRGAEALASLGCVSCHERRGNARPLAALRSAECRLILTKWDKGGKEAVESFLRGPADRSPAPVYEFPVRLAKYNCTACHRPGTDAPGLDGAGEKLKTSWIGAVLWEKKRIRPGRELRMPDYSENEMRPWLSSFAKVEGLAPGDGATPPAFADAKRAEGLGMLGTNPKTKGMSCIGCHDWGAYKSLGEEGPQLIDAASRMRFDWFKRWMRNPARILSGTSMPNYFSSLPRARAVDSIHTLWAGLELGAKAPVPDGYRAGDLEVYGEAKPVPGKEAILVRWDMPEATPAAIAVGLPGGLSYCFDAGENRVLYAWSGGFIDLKGTLLRKTDPNRRTPTAGLVGEIFWRGTEFPIRMGPERRIPQRRFKGYRLIDGFPQFHYQIDGLDVFEKLTPVMGQKAIRRELTFSRVDQQVFFEGRAVPRGTNVKLEAKLSQ